MQFNDGKHFGTEVHQFLIFRESIFDQLVARKQSVFFSITGCSDQLGCTSINSVALKLKTLNIN